MTLEAPAGKNPITHVEKIYTVVAQDIADKLVREMPEIAKAPCLMVSQIGTPVSRPTMLQIRLATRQGIPVAQLRKRVEEIAADRLAYIPRLVDDLVAGTIDVF
jgi:S-adenosylmethionine synthetase